MADGVRSFFEEAEMPDTTSKKPLNGTMVLLVQSIACAVLLLLVWLFKLLGGTGYTQLKTAFQNALHNNALLETVSQLFSEKAPDETYILQGGTTAVTTAATTATATETTSATTPSTTPTTDAANR